MPNETYAREWIDFAYRNLLTAIRLNEVDHFTDIIVIELQQTIEKLLKALLAYENRKIPKSHFLDELASLTTMIEFDDRELSLLEKATDYYREDRYPNPRYTLPTEAETEELLDFTRTLFETTCRLTHTSKERYPL